MQQDGASFFAHFVVEILKRREPGAVFLYLHPAARQQPLQSLLEAFAQFHGGKV